MVLIAMRRLRKTILRAPGHIALHDEEAAFGTETDAPTRRAADRRADWPGGAAAFEAVLPDGVEEVIRALSLRHLPRADPATRPDSQARLAAPRRANADDHGRTRS